VVCFLHRMRRGDDLTSEAGAGMTRFTNKLTHSNIHFNMSNNVENHFSGSPGTVAVHSIAPRGVVIDCEHTMTMRTDAFRAAAAFNLMPDVVALKKHFSEIVIQNVRAEVRQDNLLGDGDGFLSPTGRVFVAVIPSGKNTDASSGSSKNVVLSVRKKQAFPLSMTEQENRIFSFDVSDFETDVAQDPRRQQGPVAWIGNTGVSASGDRKGLAFDFCSVTWYFSCRCSGVSASW